MSSLEGEARMARVAAGRSHEPRSETRDGMRIDWDVQIAMDDGLVLRADVFRPIAEGRYPVILSYGPYAKGLAFQDGYPSAWERMAEKHPDVAAGSSNLTRAGKWSIPKNGCRTSTPACASTLAAPGARPDSSIISRRARLRTFTTALSGPACSRGRTARSVSTASPTTASINGTWRACSRRTLLPCASGRGPPIGTAT